MKNDIFQALADPVRRKIMELLFPGNLNMNAIAGNFKISRPAVSRHVKILTDCGLIMIHVHGREKICEANYKKFMGVIEWMEKFFTLTSPEYNPEKTKINNEPARVKKQKSEKRKKKKKKKGR